MNSVDPTSPYQPSRRSSSEVPTSPQRRSPPNPHSASTISDNSNSCCIGKIWDGICRFFVWLCPCLFGPTPPALHPAEQAAKTFVNTHYTDMIRVYGKHQTIPPIEAFKALEQDAQWHVLLELMTHTPPLPLKHVHTYIRINPKITHEVRGELQLKRMKQLTSRDPNEIKRLSGLLTDFLKRTTLAIQASSLSDAEQLQREELDSSTGGGSYPPYSEPHDLGPGFKNDTKSFNRDDIKPFQPYDG